MPILQCEIPIHYCLWKDIGDQPLRGLLQIFHGMAEHIERYEDFARFLNSKGYIVAGMNVRGHGETGLKQVEQGTSGGMLGNFAERDGWSKILEDQHALYQELKGMYPDLPFYLLGHSMGSFLARTYIHTYPEDFHAAVIMGTGAADDPAYSGARLLLRFLRRSSLSKLVHALAFGGYNKGFANPRTVFDWLSTDSKEVDKYIADPLCGFPVTNGFYQDFMAGMKRVANLEKDMVYRGPVLFVAGDRDPVGNSGKAVQEVYSAYVSKRGGVELRLYSGMRHEILNETDRAKVYEDIGAWLDARHLGDEISRPSFNER